jgi:hypothetical protein
MKKLYATLAVIALVVASVFTFNIEGVNAAPDQPAKVAQVARPDHPMSVVQPICDWINVRRYGPEPNSTYTMCEAWHIYGSHQAWMIFMSISSGDWYCTIVDIYTKKEVNYGWNSC